MVEKSVIERKLLLCEEYLRDLDAIKNNSLDNFLGDKVKQRFVERTLHLIIEACLDMANHIISYEGWREPKDNKDVFVVLCENKILDDTLTKQLAKMAQFRNLLVHDYAKIEPSIIYSIATSNIVDIILFVKAIKLKIA